MTDRREAGHGVTGVVSEPLVGMGPQITYTIIYNSIHHMATKTISFRATNDQIKLIDELVEKGDYTSRGELLRNLLRNIEKKELTDKVKKEIKIARKQEGRPLDDIL